MKATPADVLSPAGFLRLLARPKEGASGDDGSPGSGIIFRQPVWCVEHCEKFAVQWRPAVGCTSGAAAGKVSSYLRRNKSLIHDKNGIIGGRFAG
jgi:hypothetical protein